MKRQAIHPHELPEAAINGGFVTDAQLARHRSVSTRTIREWKKRGYIPFQKINRVLRFRIPDVDAALAERFEIPAKKPYQK